MRTRSDKWIWIFVVLVVVGVVSQLGSTEEPLPTNEEYAEYERGLNRTDLAVSFADLPPAVAPGAQLDVVIGIDNLGPNPTNGLAIVVPVPEGTTVLPNPACTNADGTVECELQRLAPPGYLDHKSVWEVVLSFEVAADYLANHGDSLVVEVLVENRAGDDNDPANNNVSAEVSVSP